MRTLKETKCVARKVVNSLWNRMRIIERTDFAEDFSQFKGATLEKRYTIFTLGQDGKENVDLLIRTGNDGRDATGSVIAVTHKLEYLPEFGAEVILVVWCVMLYQL